MSMPPEACPVVVAPEVRPAACGLARQEALVATVIRGERDGACLLWRSSEALIVSLRDAALPGFDSARTAMESVGWPVLLRRSGGQAFAIGPGTLQVALIAKRERRRNAIDLAYESLARPLVNALQGFGLGAQVGEVAGAVCAGRYDIALGGLKVAGLSQSWRRTADGGTCVAAFASLIVDCEVSRMTCAVNRFYALAGNPNRYSATTMTSVAAQMSPGQSAADLAARVMQAVANTLGAARDIITERADAA